jgi:hypothetical protein
LIKVFGVDMDGMEDLWREHIGAQPRKGATRATPAPSPTFTLEPTATSTVNATSTPKVATPATATSVAIAPTATPTPTPAKPATPTSTPVPQGGRLCLGALPSIALLALFAFLRPRPTP